MVNTNNRLSIKFPKLAKEWHSTKNEKLTPDDVSYGSGKKIWWQCKNEHEWESAISNRTAGKGCPYCSGKRVSDMNRLSIKFPKLVKQWHPTKNDNSKPIDFSYGSHEKVWWQCKNGHEWEASIAKRCGGRNCPYCSRRKVSDSN